MKSINTLLCLLLLSPASASAWQWQDLWRTPDQQASRLLQAGKAREAADVFRDKNWQSVSHYRAGNYAQAFKQFSHDKSSDGQYNAGNAAAFMEHYQEAITAYDKAIALNPNNKDAIANREIVKKILEQKPPQQQNQSADKDKKDESKSSADKNNSQQNSEKNKQTDKQNNSQANNKQEPGNNTKSNPSKNSGDQDQPNNIQANATNKQQRQDENNKQLLRRLTDDAGGLLQQKFLRDYGRRHGIDDNSDQGMN